MFCAGDHVRVFEAAVSEARREVLGQTFYVCVPELTFFSPFCTVLPKGACFCIRT